jgi:hypothetical protein
MPVKLNSTGGGSVTLDVGSTATNFTQTLPSATTTIVGTDTTQTLTNKTIGSGYGGGVITQGTAVSASGTAVDFTGIPSWAKKITVMFNGVSSNGTSTFTIQMGSGSFETTGYSSAASVIDFAGAFNGGGSSSAYRIMFSAYAAEAYSGIATIANLSGNTWVQSGVVTSASTTHQSAGSKSFGGVVDRLRISTSSGTQTFDAGTINIQYEG